MEYHKIKPLIKSNQKYKAYTSRLTLALMLRHRQEARLSPRQVALSATVKQHRALLAAGALAANKSLHAALIAGAVYDQKLGKWMRHKQLINHPDPEI